MKRKNELDSTYMNCQIVFSVVVHVIIAIIFPNLTLF